MPQAVAKCLIPIHLCRMRITRLDSLGNVVPTANNSYVTNKPIDLKIKPVMEAGDEKTLKGGCACIVASVKEPDLFKRIEFEFESRNFRDHGHPPDGCDIIVCWRHNWAECPEHLEIIREDYMAVLEPEIEKIPDDKNFGCFLLNRLQELNDIFLPLQAGQAIGCTEMEV